MGALKRAVAGLGCSVPHAQPRVSRDNAEVIPSERQTCPAGDQRDESHLCRKSPVHTCAWHVAGAGQEKTLQGSPPPWDSNWDPGCILTLRCSGTERSAPPSAAPRACTTQACQQLPRPPTTASPALDTLWRAATGSPFPTLPPPLPPSRPR